MTGLIIQAGYGQEGQDGLFLESETSISHDEMYAIIEGRRYLLPPMMSELGRMLLRNGRTSYTRDSIPNFLLKEFKDVVPHFDIIIGKNAGQIRIYQDPLKPIMIVDYDRSKGLLITTGYEITEDDQTKYVFSWERTFDGKYAMIDETFIPLPHPGSWSGGRWFPSRDRIVEPEDIPSFLESEHVFELKEGFNVTFTENVEEIDFSYIPLKTIARIDYVENRELNVTTGYQRNQIDELITSDKLRRSTDGRFAIIDDKFYPIPENLTAKQLDWLEKGEISMDKRAIPYFFMKDLLQLRIANFNIQLTDSAERITIVERPTFKVAINEPGWLDYSVQYSTEDLEKFLRNATEWNDAPLQIDEYNWIFVRRDAVEGIKRLVSGSQQVAETGTYRIPLTEFGTIDQLIDEIGGMKEVSGEYQRFLDCITDFNYNPEFRLPDDIEDGFKSKDIDLYPHQRSGIQWMDWLVKNQLHGILADDMGLGKTLQTIATIYLEYSRTGSEMNSLIICPKSVRGFWVREIRKWFPQLLVFPYEGKKRQRYWDFLRKTIFISSYDLITRDIDYIKKNLLFVVLDEGTNIKNPNTQRSKAIKMLNSTHRLVLTGTPIENRPMELWSIFEFLMKGHLGSHTEFKREFESPIIEGDTDAVIRLQSRIRPFILRRLKEDVADFLPEKIPMYEYCDLTTEQKILYQSIQDQEIPFFIGKLEAGAPFDYLSLTAVIMRLKQVCDHPALIGGGKEPILGRSMKFDLTVEKVKEIKVQDEKVVIFSQFLEPLNMFERIFKENMISFIRLDGSTKQRSLVVDRFNEGNIDVALCSVKATAYGITLTAANHVIHFNRWWNPAVENQATDRVHRIGQDKTVYVHHIINSNTLEEKIDALLRRKQKLFDTIIGDLAGKDIRWTREELLEILHP